jgi:hypothetical protein
LGRSWAMILKMLSAISIQQSDKKASIAGCK